MIEDLYAKLRGVLSVPDCCVCDDLGCEHCPAVDREWPEYAARMDLDPQDAD